MRSARFLRALRRRHFSMEGGPPARRAWLGACLAAGIVLGLVALNAAGVVHFSPPGQSSVPLPAAPGCRAPSPLVANSSGPHGLYVINPPTTIYAPHYAETVAYLRNNSVLCGAAFQVHWSGVDRGPSASPEFNWTSVDSEIAPWVAAGKQVGLIFQAVGYGPNQSYVPPYVLSQVATMRCGNSSVTPLFWQAPYVQAYRALVRAAVEHFGNQSSTAYLRFGLGTGGETFPLYDLKSPGCLAVLNATGFTIPLWEGYLGSMLDYLHSTRSRAPLMVALNGVYPGGKDNVSAFVGARAASDHVAMGTESLLAADIAKTANGSVHCPASWCAIFNQYTGRVPLEVQTYSASSPDGSGTTGSLIPLLPLALGAHAQIFELYLSDWLTAFDPGYPGFAVYGRSYAAALAQVAQVIGEAK